MRTYKITKANKSYLVRANDEISAIKKVCKINDARVLGYVIEIKGIGWVMSEDALTFGSSSKDAFLFPSEAKARQAILAHNDYFYHKGYNKKIYMWERIEWTGGPKGSFVTTGNRGIPIPLIPPRRFDDSFPSRETVKRIRAQYPVGCRVELIHMDDPQAPPIGTKGTVRYVDDIGNIGVEWDNGSTLQVVYGVDSCRKI